MPHGSKATSQGPLVVGRAAEVGYLEQCLEAALGGERQIVFVSGESGIGKTTIVESFLERLRSRTDLRIGHGQCIEQYGSGEAYLPLLEVGTRICQGPESELAIALLRQYAPTWLVQLPGVVADAEWELLQRRVQGATRERMLREAAEVVARFTQERGHVLVLEDLHWSDVSTLEWLSYIARRQEAAKLLIVGTYRPQDVLISGHPLRGVVQDLTARNRGEELRVAPLSEQSVSEYLIGRFGSSVSASVLPGLIHRRTGGNPLFMVNVVEYLTQQHRWRQEEEQWLKNVEVTVAAEGVPQNLQHLIDRQLERLPEDAQRLLEVASVTGMEFSSAEVATGLQIEVEALCDDLVRKEQFLRGLGAEEWPDGTLGERYGFLHALYRDVLYGRLAETRRVRLHRRIGERKEAAYGQRTSEIAAELAAHFEAGRDIKRAVHYLQRAGENALQRYANREAINHLTKGLGFLKALPDSPKSFQQELSLQMALGPALIATKGYAASEVEQTYSRARELCQQLEDSSVLFPALFGLWSYYITRAEQRPTRELAEQMSALARQHNDPALLLQAHRALTETFFWMGEFLAAYEHGEQGIALYDPQQHHAHVLLYSEEPGADCRAITAWVLWYLGYPEQALEKSAEALALARQETHPYSEAMALTLETQVLLLRGEIPVARVRAEEGIALAAAQGFPFWETWGTVLHGWTLAQLEQGEEGIAQIQQALEVYPAVEFRTWNLALLAEAYGSTGQIDEGLKLLTEAIAMVEQTGERFYEAELYRLKGQLTLAQSSVRGPESGVQESQESKGKRQKSEIPTPQSHILNPQSHAEAEACFLKALEIARQQQARSWELRTTTSLARLWQSQGKSTEARQLLEDIYGWFTEGFDTKDLQEAEALLVSLGGTVRTKEESQKSKISAPRLLTPDLFSSSPQPLAPSQQSPTTSTLVLSQPLVLNPQSSALFRHEGEYWTLTFGGTTCRIRDTLGLRYLAQLLTRPHQELHVLTLAAEEPALTTGVPIGEAPGEGVQSGFTDAGEVLDPQARAAYRQRLRDLQEELSEAQSFNDPGRIEKLQDEIEFLTQELAQAVGLGGRTRKAASVAERARVNVTKRIKIALRKIGEQHPTLGEHLTQTIRTGTFCVYAPSPHQPVTWQG